MNGTGSPSLISIDMAGIAEATKIALDLVVPWRRKNAQRLAKLDTARREAEIHRLNAETLTEQAKAQRERLSDVDRSQAELILAQAKKTEAEAALVYAQADKARAEAEKERSAIRQSQIELALKIVAQYSEGLNQTQKLEFAIRLLPSLDILTTSPITIVDNRARGDEDA